MYKRQTLGTGYEVFGAQVYTTATGHSYFIPLNGDGSKPLTGKAALCKHTWGTPVWNWAEDYSKATVTFTCTKDASHTKTGEATAVSYTHLDVYKRQAYNRSHLLQNRLSDSGWDQAFQLCCLSVRR